MSLRRFTLALLLIGSAAGAQIPWEDWEPRPGSLPRLGHENDVIALGLGVASAGLAAANLTFKGEGARSLAGVGAAIGLVSTGAGLHMRHTATAHSALTWSAIGLGLVSASTGTFKLIRRDRHRDSAIELSPTVAPRSSESPPTLGIRATLRF